MNSQHIRINHKNKLTMQKEEAVDPLFHLFTEIPLTSFEKDPEFFSKNIKDSNKSYQTPSLRSNRSFFHNSQVDSYQLIDKKTRKKSINQHSQYSNSLSMKVSSYDSIKEYKIKKICINFMRKLRRNNIFSKPVLQQNLVLSPQLNRKGITINQTFKLYWAVISWIILASLFLFQTLLITFSQLKDSQIIQIFIYLGFMFIIGEMGLGFTQIKYIQGKQVKILTQIIKIYSKKQFFLDASIFLFLFLIIGQFTIVANQIFVLIILFKLFSLQKRLQIIQNSVIKVILLNLFIAHVISILLNLMITSNPNDNWQIVKGIADSWWFERYVWSFYWSVAIMTTVGFGGIAPASYSQAIWIIIIQIACCLLLAYNISYLYNNFGKCAKHEGTKSTKSFEKIVVNKDISPDLKKKIKDYIVAKEEIQNKLNILQNQGMVQALPQALKKQISQQSIKNAIKYLPFFDNLHLKVIHSLTQSIQRKIYLPNQIIKNFDDLNNIYILENGEIGYSCRSYRSKLNSYITDFVKTSQLYKSHLLSLDFITRGRQKYDIKSISCSIILKLPLQNLRTHLFKSFSSFQLYCYLRDKSRCIIDQYQTVPCKSQCRSKHTMMTCPKLHFVPIQQLVVSKYLKNALNSHQRVTRKVLTSRMMRRKLNTLNISKYCQEQHSKYPAFSLNRSKQRKGVYISVENTNNFIILHSNNQLKTREERAEDEIWIIASDNIQNYKRYFPEGNLESIIRKRNLASLMRRETEI